MKTSKNLFVEPIPDPDLRTPSWLEDPSALRAPPLVGEDVFFDQHCLFESVLPYQRRACPELDSGCPEGAEGSYAIRLKFRLDPTRGFSLAVIIFFATVLTSCTTPSDPTPDFTPRFTEVAQSAGLGDFKHETDGYGQSLMPEIVGGGGGFIDYDNDGWEDILLVGGGAWMHHEKRDIQALYLYKNQKNGTFIDVTREAGLADIRAYGFGVTAADIDNDGDTDFLLTTLHQNMLFLNENGVFEEITREAGLGDKSVWSTSAAFFDADRDGWLDLYVGNYVDWSPEKDLMCMHKEEKVFCTPQEYTGRASSFYRNTGRGLFVDQTKEAGFLTDVDTTLDKTLGVAIFDFNKDGWPDVAMGNDTENDMLFVNQGDGLFREMGLQSGIAVSQHGSARAGMGIDTGVVDSTGFVSIFVGNFSDETVSVFRYSGHGQFQDRAAISKIAYPSNLTLTFGLALFDVDLDTDLDLLTANGHVLTHINEISEAVRFRQPAQLYLNRGNGIFDEFVASNGPLTIPMVARGLAYADYDRDGDVDVLIVENGGAAHLWRNEIAHRSFLSIALKGVQSNREGIGARIEAVSGELKMERTVKTGSSFLSNSTKKAFFGLGARSKIDTLYVYWPSGATDKFINVPGNREILITEGMGDYESIIL